MTLATLASGDVFFQKILHRGLQDQTIQDVMLVEKKPAVNKGENYLSELTRFTLKYRCNVPKGHSGEKVDRVVHLIIKEEPNVSPETLELIRKTNIFNTERVMLEEVVPRIEELIGRRLGPKVYYSSIDPQIIVMEDLVACGFKNKNRKVGLNEEQAFLVLEYMADFHAASILLDQQDPQFVSRFRNGLINDITSQNFFSYLSKGVEIIADQVSAWPDKQFVLIAEKLRKRSKDLSQKLKEIYQCDEDELRVLNHGDMWINNIMIRDDENGQPEEVRFIDYQLPVWTSPAIDLLYFLSITPERNLKMTNDDVFLEKYLTRLTSAMKKLGFFKDPPTIRQLKKSMHKRRAFVLLAALVFWPKMLAEEEDVKPIDDMIQNAGEIGVNPLKYPHAKEVMEKILPILNERGYLD
ncbi:uncharacterized protein LOC107043063 [Diachasma alloeum]|uniref:uncharacterized protein LOC107043063 n=1 Tax=Diachasma alloeum TaxID=454923 RepID=UPI0007382688|nr:uncharacterized protein LOC107043063 [Diachasma alloeum]